MAAPQQPEFLAEARDHLADVCDQLLRLERATGDDARARVEQMLRAVHSIKGGAAYFALRNIEQLAHRMESVLEATLGKPFTAEIPIVDVLLAGIDRLAALLDDIDHSNQAKIGDLLQRLDEQLVRLTEAETVPLVPEATVDIEVSTTPSQPAKIPAAHRFDYTIDLSHCHAAGVSPVEVFRRVAELGDVVSGAIDSPAVDLETSPPQHPVVWRGIIQSSLEPTAFRERLALPAETASPPPGTPADPNRGNVTATAPAASGSSTIRISVDLVDQLMNLAGELVLVRNQSRRFADQNQPLPGPVIQRLDSVTSEFQQTVLQTRMQPVGNLFNKFPRLVRDLSRQLEKQLELRIEGADVEIDKTILDALSDPLTHLIRNACDHGIESAEERARAAKPSVGTLRLTARHFGDQIWITIEDDGRGIDRERVRQKALEQRLRSADELAALDDRELLALILLPGFSTARQVTDVSGRGVGMDVVKTNLARLGGSVDIDSRQGAGTRFTLRLPLTLTIIPTLLVTADGERFAIPQKDLEELVFVDPGQSHVRVETTPQGELVRLRGQLLPLVRLAHVLHFGHQPRAQPVAVDDNSNSLLFAVVRAGSRRFALVVDTILTSEEIVVKPMHSGLRRLTMYSGATVLGDGRVALILSTEGIAQRARIRFYGDAERATSASTEAAIERQSVLLVRQLTGEPLAIPLALIQRLVLTSADRVELVSGEYFVNIDQVPTRLFVPRHGALQPPTGKEPVYVVVARGADPPAGCLVGDIVGTEEITVSSLHSLGDKSGAVGGAIIAGQITPLADFGEQIGQRDAAATSSWAPRGTRVLLVDDTQFFRDVVGRYLTEHGFHVTTAEQGEAGLALLAREKFDIVVSDLEMPIMDGWTLATSIRQDPRNRHLPLLALSTLAGDEAEARSIAHGFDAHEVKLDRASLLNAIEMLVASRSKPGTAGEKSHA